MQKKKLKDIYIICRTYIQLYTHMCRNEKCRVTYVLNNTFCNFESHVLWRIYRILTITHNCAARLVHFSCRTRRITICLTAHIQNYKPIYMYSSALCHLAKYRWMLASTKQKNHINMSTNVTRAPLTKTSGKYPVCFYIRVPVKFV